MDEESGRVFVTAIRRGVSRLSLSVGLIALLLAAPLRGEPAPDAGQSLERTIVPGETQRFELSLTQGELLTGSVDASAGSRVTLTVQTSAGARVRKFSQRASGPMRYAFVAPASGRYELALQNARSEKAAYVLRVDRQGSLAAEAPVNKPASPVTDKRLQAFLDAPQGVARDSPAFWRDVIAQGGTPLIQPEGKQYRVTFLYRGHADTHKVGLRWPVRPREPTDLEPVAGTDIWHKSVLLPAGMRFTYKLVPDAPQYAGLAPDLAELSVAQADPLNPRRWSPVQDGDIYSDASLVELPGAVNDTRVVLQPGVAAGEVKKLRFHSKALDNERDIAVYLPHGYRPDGGPYDLMVLFDGEAYIDWVPVPVILSNLIAAKAIPPTVAVFIGNASASSRNTELPANPVFADFLVTELIPWIRQRFAVTTDPSRTTVGGASFGGLAAAYAGFRHPEVFGAVLSQSGSYWWSPQRNFLDASAYDEHAEPGWMVRTLASANKASVRFYLDAGWFEDSPAANLLDSNRALRDVLIAKGYAVHYKEFVGGHEYVNWRQTFADAVLALQKPRATDDLHAQIDKGATAVEAALIAWRRDIHEHPELGHLERRTSRLVANHLRKLGMDVTTGVAGTGVVGVLKSGRAGPVVALRADMDALPVSEQTSLPFASKAVSPYLGRTVQVMHACGHDAHTAILMAAATVLAGVKDRLNGTVKFIFQPAEEGPADWIPDGKRKWGAEQMIDEGVLQNPKVDAIFALHVTSTLPAGQLAWRPGPATASNDLFEIDVHGSQTHGAVPWRGVDPVVVAAQIVSGIQTIASRQVDVTREPSVITVGTIHGGEKSSIIPDVVQLSGTIRTYDQAMREDLHARLTRTSEMIAQSANARAVVRVIGLQNPSVNHTELTARMSGTLSRVGASRGARVAEKIMGAEDFSSYQREIPGLIFLLGIAAPNAPKPAAPNHSPMFTIDESGLIQGVRAMASLAADYLGNAQVR